MSDWIVLAASRRGKRAANDDFAASGLVRARRRAFVVAAICDGVGSRPGSGQCAAEVGQACIDTTRQYLRRHRPTSPLTRKDASGLLRRLTSLSSCVNGHADQATTVAMTVSDNRALLALWSGDSRAYWLDAQGRLLTLTQDHCGQDRELTSYVRGDGILAGPLSYTFQQLPRHGVCLCLTSDGVHGACTYSELRSFLLWCVSRRIGDNESLAEALDTFLRNNAADNYSMCLCYNRAAGKRLLSRAPVLLRTT